MMGLLSGCGGARWINAGFRLDELAIEAGLRERQRPTPGELVAREIAVFITGRALIIAGKGCRAQVMLTGGPGLRWR
jgi:hypothetical protein